MPVPVWATHRKRIWAALFAVLALLAIIWVLHHDRHNVRIITVNRRDTDVANDDRQADVCHYFPVDASNELALIFKKNVTLDCPFKEPLTRIHPVTGKLILTLSKVYKNDYTCRYRFFRRREGNEIDNDYEDWQAFPNDGVVNMTMEKNLIKVSCSNFWGLEVYANSHVFIPSYPSEHVSSPSRPSVVVLMIESLSQHGFKRQMPMTQKQIQQMSGQYLDYFVKSHDNTFPNAFAFLTGLPNTLHPDSKSPVYDWEKIDFLWNVYKREGYTTAFLEDLPTEMDGLFQYYGRGFRKAPTDFYPHAFWKEFYSSWTSFNSIDRHMFFKRDFCDGTNGRKIDVFLEQVVRFVNKNHRIPFFVYAMAAQMTHEDVNSLSWLDESLSQALRKIHQADNHTIIVVAGDHGFRRGYSCANSIGRLEERMSLMSIIIPEAVHVAYPHMRGMMNLNENRLISFRDIHQMLKNIASGTFRALPSTDTLPRASGPIDPTRELVDEFRSCRDAGIQPEYCVCGRDVHLSLSERHNIVDRMMGITDDLDNISALTQFYVSNKCDPSFVTKSAHYRLPHRNQSLLNEQVIVRLVNERGDSMTLNLYRNWARGLPSDWLISRNAKCRS